MPSSPVSKVVPLTLRALLDISTERLAELKRNIQIQIAYRKQRQKQEQFPQLQQQTEKKEEEKDVENPPPRKLSLQQTVVQRYGSEVTIRQVLTGEAKRLSFSERLSRSRKSVASDVAESEERKATANVRKWYSQRKKKKKLLEDEEDSEEERLFLEDSSGSSSSMRFLGQEKPSLLLNDPMKEATAELVYNAHTTSLEIIEKPIFIKEVTRCIHQLHPMQKKRKCFITAKEIFQHIDYDCKEIISWDQFTEFLIEQAQELNMMLTSTEQFNRYVRREHPVAPNETKKILHVRNASRHLKYPSFILVVTRTETLLCSPLTFEVFHVLPKVDFNINDVIYIGFQDMMAAYHSSTTASSVRKKQKHPNNGSSTNTEGASNSLLLTLANSGAADQASSLLNEGCEPVLIICGSDLHLHFYDMGTKSYNTYVLKEIKRCRSEATIMKMSSYDGKMFCGDRDGKIVMYDATTLIDPKRKLIDAQMGFFCRAHTKAITGLLHIAGSILLSSSLDGYVSSNDLTTLETVRKFHAHDGGISILGYSPRQGIIVTQGFCKTTTIWIGFSGTHSFDLFDGNNPHLSSIVAVEVIDDLYQILTMDCSGLLKIWDIRRNVCLHDVLIQHDVSDVQRRASDISVAPVQRIVYVHAHHRVITSGYRLAAVLDFVPGEALLQSHDDPVRMLVASSTSRCVISATGSEIKVWDVEQGGLRRCTIVRTADYGDATSLCLDNTDSKMFFGTTKGFIAEIRLSSGRQLKIFRASRDIPFPEAEVVTDSNQGASLLQQPSSSTAAAAASMNSHEICSLFYISQEKWVAGVCADGTLLCFTDEGEQRIPVKCVNLLQFQVPKGPPAVTSPLLSHQKSTRSMLLLKRQQTAGGTGASFFTSPLLKGGSLVSPTSVGILSPSRKFLHNNNMQLLDNYTTCFSPYSRLVSIGTPAGELRLIDILSSSGSPLHQFFLAADISCQCFLGAYPILVVGGSNGMISLFAVRPLTSKLKRERARQSLCSVDNVTSPQSCIFDPHKGLLYIGDDHCKISCYCVVNFIRAFQLAPIQPETFMDTVSPAVMARSRSMRKVSFSHKIKSKPKTASNIEQGGEGLTIDPSMAFTSSKSTIFSPTDIPNVVATVEEEEDDESDDNDEQGERGEKEKELSATFLTSTQDDLEEFLQTQMIQSTDESDDPWIMLISTVDAKGSGAKVGGQITCLSLLSNSNLVAADLAGNVSIWLPELSGRVCNINPSTAFHPRMIYPLEAVDFAHVHRHLLKSDEAVRLRRGKNTRRDALALTKTLASLQLTTAADPLNKNQVVLLSSLDSTSSELNSKTSQTIPPFSQSVVEGEEAPLSLPAQIKLSGVTSEQVHAKRTSEANDAKSQSFSLQRRKNMGSVSTLGSNLSYFRRWGGGEEEGEERHNNAHPVPYPIQNPKQAHNCLVSLANESGHPTPEGSGPPVTARRRNSATAEVQIRQAIRPQSAAVKHYISHGIEEVGSIPLRLHPTRGLVPVKPHVTITEASQNMRMEWGGSALYQQERYKAELMLTSNKKQADGSRSTVIHHPKKVDVENQQKSWQKIEAMLKTEDEEVAVSKNNDIKKDVGEEKEKEQEPIQNRYGLILPQKEVEKVERADRHKEFGLPVQYHHKRNRRYSWE